MEAFDGPLDSLPRSDDFYHLELNHKTKGKKGKKLTVGHPVSAIYIEGLFDNVWANATSVCSKKSFVHPAPSAAETFANHG